MLSADGGADDDGDGDDDDESAVKGWDEGEYPERLWNDEHNYTRRLRLNREMIAQLKRNEPSLTSLEIKSFDVDIIDWAVDGSCLSNNTHLKGLKVSQDTGSAADCTDLFKAIAKNRSIKDITICMEYGVADAGVIIPIMSEFIDIEHNNKLRNIDFRFGMGDRGGDLLASALSNCTHKLLRKVELDMAPGVSNEISTKILTALGDYRNLVTLSLTSSIGRNGFIAISNLLQRTAMQKLCLNYCDMDDDKISILSKALINNNTLKIFSSRGTLQFAKCFLQNPHSVLEELLLRDLELELDDAAVSAMAIGLSSITTLKRLHFSSYDDISSDGWQSFFSILQSPRTSLETLNISGYYTGKDVANALTNNTTLQTLDLSHCHFVNRGAVAIGKCLFTNKTLKSLDLSFARYSCIGTIGWQALFSALRSPESASLGLSNAGVDDDGLAALASALDTNGSLKDLDFSTNGSISHAGWINFFSSLHSNKLEDLNLCGNNINDGVVPTIVTALINQCSSLKKLGINRTEITSVGWREVTTVLLRHSKVQELLFGGGTVGGANDDYLVDDETLSMFANTLVDNKTLKGLEIHCTQEITERGWNVIANVLCNKSTINSTFLSNHTLKRVTRPYDEDRIPSDVVTLLRLNRENDEVGAARMKILRYHFPDDGANMQLFVDMELGILPHALAWAGRDYVKEGRND